MRIILLITFVFVGSVRAIGQQPAIDVARPVAEDDAVAAPQQNELEPPDDPVGRLENRLDRIERRLDQQNAPLDIVEPQALSDPAPAEATNSRYHYQDGVWWYWLPSNRWVYWSNGKWVDHFPDTTRTTVLYRSAVPAYSYFPSYSYRYPRSFSSYSLYDYDYPRLYSSYGSYPTYGLSYYGGYGGYGGYRGYGGWGSAIGLGLSIGHAFSHHHGHHHLGHNHFGHRHHGHFGHHHGHHHHHH